MNLKLTNRKAVHKKLNGFVGGMAVSDQMVDTICNRSGVFGAGIPGVPISKPPPSASYYCETL